MGTRTETLARRAGLAAGLALAAALVVVGRVPGGNGTLGADLIVAARPRGVLGVRPAGPFLEAPGLRPGEVARGALDIVNQAGVDLAVRVRALPSSTGLDDLLRIVIDAGPDRLFVGTLGELRTWSRRTVRLAPGQARTLAVRAWLPASVGEGYEGRVEQVGLEFDPAPVQEAP